MSRQEPDLLVQELALLRLDLSRARAVEDTRPRIPVLCMNCRLFQRLAGAGGRIGECAYLARGMWEDGKRWTLVRVLPQWRCIVGNVAHPGLPHHSWGGKEEP